MSGLINLPIVLASCVSLLNCPFKEFAKTSAYRDRFGGIDHQPCRAPTAAEKNKRSALEEAGMVALFLFSMFV